jgi:anaerobic magnesium-protoporphyrin IX monomethyl ester cyclase
MINKKIDILFIHANASSKVYQDLSKNYSAIEPPIWAALLANNARKNGFSVKILDCEAERLDSHNSAEAIVSECAKLNVFVVYGQQPSASTQNMQGVRSLLNELKQYDKGKTLLVGLHPSAVSRQTLIDENIDFVCQGEGPYTISGLLNCNDMNDDKNLANIPGLWYWKDKKVVFTKPAKIIPQEKLKEELPGMAWDLLPMSKYRTSNWHAMSNNDDKEPFASLYTSLGCPFRCSFCCINAPFGNNNLENWDYARNKFRYWDTDFIIEEFDKINELGIKNVKIADEMFVLNKNHFLDLCNKLIERNYNFNIWAYARIDTVKEEYLKTLKQAGVNWLALGIESGNAVVRKDVVKGKFTEVNIVDLVKKIQQAGINVIGNYIFGLPEDTIDSMKETLKLAKDLNCEFANFYCAMAYPGSKLYLDALKNNWDLPDSYEGYSQHSYEMKPLKTNHLKASEVVKFRDDAFHDYYEDVKYLDFIEKKFGLSTRKEIEKMTAYRLKRKILGD